MDPIAFQTRLLKLQESHATPKVTSYAHLPGIRRSNVDSLLIPYLQWTIDRNENCFILVWINSNLGTPRRLTFDAYSPTAKGAFCEDSIYPEIYYNPNDPFLVGLGGLEAMTNTMGGTYEGPIVSKTIAINSANAN
jgi:hypothetical protein